jgi:hypothetical protein
MTLEQLQQQEHELTQLLSENRAKQREIRRTEFYQRYGANIGDIVKWHNGITNRKGKIYFVSRDFCKVLLLKKDGTVGNRDAIILPTVFHTIEVIIKQS